MMQQIQQEPFCQLGIQENMTWDGSQRDSVNHAGCVAVIFAFFFFNVFPKTQIQFQCVHFWRNVDKIISLGSGFMQSGLTSGSSFTASFVLYT